MVTMRGTCTFSQGVAHGDCVNVRTSVTLISQQTWVLAFFLGKPSTYRFVGLQPGLKTDPSGLLARFWLIFVADALLQVLSRLC